VDAPFPVIIASMITTITNSTAAEDVDPLVADLPDGNGELSSSRDLCDVLHESVTPPDFPLLLRSLQRSSAALLSCWYLPSRLIWLFQRVSR